MLLPCRSRGTSTTLISAFHSHHPAACRGLGQGSKPRWTRQASTTASASQDEPVEVLSPVAKNTAASIERKLRRGLGKMKVVMTPEFFTADPAVLGPFYSKLPKSVEVKQSSIAPDVGLGLFAKKNIKAYTIVSFYPAHALGIDDDGSASLPFVTLPDEPDNVAYFAEHCSFHSPYLHCTDQPIFQRASLLAVDGEHDNNADLPSVFLDVNPERQPLVDGWVSQMINDGATVKTRTEAGVLEYYQQSAIAKNCIHIPLGPSPIMATMTTKKVKKGQELLTTYGATYWLGALATNDPQTGDENVSITPEIQKEIQETAKDLLVCLKNAQTVYANQIAALQAAFDAVQV